MTQILISLGILAALGADLALEPRRPAPAAPGGSSTPGRGASRANRLPTERPGRPQSRQGNRPGAPGRHTARCARLARRRRRPGAPAGIQPGPTLARRIPRLGHRFAIVAIGIERLGLPGLTRGPRARVAQPGSTRRSHALGFGPGLSPRRRRQPHPPAQQPDQSEHGSGNQPPARNQPARSLPGVALLHAHAAGHSSSLPAPRAPRGSPRDRCRRHPRCSARPRACARSPS